MFVLKSTYEAAVEEGNRYLKQLNEALRDHRDTLLKFRNLQSRTDRLLETLAQAQSALAQRQPNLTREDIQRLLGLVHPDKHGGKQAAVEMTQKLLELRKSC